MSVIKPLKRSKELAPLSREHHDGLLFVWKIRQGLRNGTSITTLCKYTRWFWINHIKPHFKEEEKVLVLYLPADHSLVKQMFYEHEQIRELIISIDREKDKDLLKSLSDLLERHIRFEERKLFEYAEKTLTAEQRKEIFDQLTDEPFCNTGWNDEFWLNKK